MSRFCALLCRVSAVTAVATSLGIAPVVGAAVRQADALDADACGHFEPNPFRALICRNCNKAKAKH